MTDPKKSAWLSYPVRKAGGGDTVVGAYGGHPRGIPHDTWPRCAVCGNPMCHMAQLDAGPWLDLDDYARMSLFICHATGGRCEDWDPWKGSNRVVLHPELDDSLYDGPPTVRVYRRRELTIDDPMDELELMIKVKEQGLPMADALQSLRHDKLGGGAVWLQGEASPPSKSGEGPMRMVLQMTTDIVNFDITPGGMAYVFVDPADPSPDSARLLWQSGS